MIDFARIAAECLSAADRLVPQWLPGGQKQGKYWVVGNLQGDPGTSLKVTLDEGCWRDWASDEKGGDLVSLYAKINGLSMGDAAKRLADELKVDTAKPAPVRPKPAPAPSTIGRPPAGAPDPEMPGAALTWCYRDADGLPLHWVARYNGPDGSKDIKPWCWDLAAGSWVCKGWPGKRPLYGLDLLAVAPGKPVMIVEGEKCAANIRMIDGCVYVVVTWSGGSKAVSKTDWSPLYGRKLLIWPDADEPGRAAADDIVKALRDFCPEIKVLDTAGQPDGWDCADAVADGWDWARIVEWAKPRARLVHPAPAPIPPPAPAAPPPAPKQPEHRPEDHVAQAQTEESGFATWDDLGLMLSDKGKPLPSLSNAVLVLERWEPLRGLCWFDEFHGRFMTKDGKGGIRQWIDHDDHELTVRIQRVLRLPQFNDELIHKAVITLAMRNTRNEVMDWIKQQTWDGTERLDDFLSDCLGAEKTPYVCAASRNFWLSLVARAANPGCKADSMLILEGGQGKRKSTALAEIAGKQWHTEAQENINGKDFYMAMQGKLLIEIAELDSFSKADATKVKQVITNRCDTYRAPYARVSEDHPRRCIFAGTTNEEVYLKDATGGRRFWPIKVGDIDLDAIRSMRAQCFAEAYHKVKAGASWWEMPAEQTAAEQEKRRQSDTWESLVRDWLYGKGEVTVASVLSECLKIEPAHQGHSEQIRAAKAIKAAGWEVHVEWNGTKTVRNYRPKR